MSSVYKAGAEGKLVGIKTRETCNVGASGQGEHRSEVSVKELSIDRGKARQGLES